MLSITNSRVRNQTVLVRVDYNFSLDRAGRIRDTTRFESTFKTIDWLLARSAKIILLSHRGRPNGWDKNYSLRPAMSVLLKRYKKNVTFYDQPITSPGIRNNLKNLNFGQIALMENLRFYPGEDNNLKALAKKLAGLGNIFINEAFPVCHRISASIVGLPRLIPSYAGFHLLKEVSELDRGLKFTSHPVVAILGGSKISTKLGLLKNLLERTDHVLLGGALANTLLQIDGISIGRSLVEPGMRQKLKKQFSQNSKIHLPCDVIVTDYPIKKRPNVRIRPVGRINRNEIIVDIGPETLNLFGAIINSAKIVIWNGPVGLYEKAPFNLGTRKLAKKLALSRAHTIAGGGETIDAINRSGLSEKFNFLSTGGGAMLEYLEGKKLPGILALS